MADGDNGGTTEGDGTQAPVTFTQEQMDAALAATAAKVKTDVWQGFQSTKDKEVAEIRSVADKAIQGYADMQAADEAKRLEGMSSEERTAYFAEKTYRATQAVGPAKPPGGSGSESPVAAGAPDGNPNTGTPPNADQASQLQAIVAKVAQEAGVDPKTLDLAGGVAGLIKSAILAGAEGAKTPEQKAKEANDKIAADRNANPNTLQGGPAGGTDIVKMNPVDLIKQGARENFAGITKPN